MEDKAPVEKLYEPPPPKLGRGAWVPDRDEVPLEQFAKSPI